MRVRSELTAPLVALSAVLLFAGPAHATITPFLSRAAFDLAVPGATVETWDDNAAGTTIPDGTSLDGVSYTTTPGPDAQVTDGFQALSLPNTLGDAGDGFFGPTETIRFGFPGGALAFGISINTFATAPGAYTATTDLGDTAPSAFDPFPGLPTGQFVGFLSDTPFSTVTLAAPSGLSYTLDDLNFLPVTVPPVAVPGPATLILVGAGLAGAASWRRSRRG
jgi:hypothetical protein